MATLNGVWSSSSASISWSNSVSTSPRRSGTLAIVRTPGPGGMRMQRSGAITPRRAAWARSKRLVWVGNRSVTWRAMSAPVAVMPMKIGPDQRADRRRGLLAQRGVGLVADDDRVGVGDPPGVAHEPLVGLDGDRAVGGVLAVEHRAGDAVAVAAVAQLAVELVDEVAAVGEDQDAAGARRLDEAQRGDGLAGAGGVLEPEALGGVGVLGLLLELAVVLVARRPASPAAPRPRAPRPRGPRRPRPRRRGRRGRESSSSSSCGVGRFGCGVGDARLDVLGDDAVGARAVGARAVGALGSRPAARSACPTARRPGGPRARCRRRGAAPPRRAGARGRAAARTGGATRSTASWRRRRPRRAAASSARRRAEPGARASSSVSPS